ncbi:MAG TPA: cupin domain-containing protein [Actinobacteria bacterium]|nr:cupin domain-containing protein [Actinomycetota bacterium]HCK78647.1 cupin domain-containing protein [Actinomycetota bacterium]
MRPVRTSIVGSALLSVAAAGLVVGCAGPASKSTTPLASTAPTPVVTTLLTKQETTVLDQPIVYPTQRPAQVTSSIVTLIPGAQTGFHRHDAPLFVHVLSGTVTVEYQDGPTKTYPAGSTFMEAQGTYHNGRNLGQVPVRILTASLGAEGVANTVPRP